MSESKLPSGRFIRGITPHRGRSHPYQVYLPSGPRPEQGWPVLLFLHGAGERGSDGRQHVAVGIGPALQAHPERFRGLVVLPQCPRHVLWSDDSALAAMTALDETIHTFSGDRRRIYLGGLSMGGFGTWYLALAYPTTFAALVPIAGFTDTDDVGGGRPGVDLPDVLLPGIAAVERARPAAVAARIGSTPTWIFHGSDDPLVPVRASRQMAAELAAQGHPVRYTEYAGVGHNSWDPALADAQLWSWLGAQQRL